MKRSVYIFFAALIAIPQLLSAQVFRDRLEKQGTKQEIRVAKRHLDRDVEEIEAFRELKKDFQIAYLSVNEEEIGAIKSSIIVYMDREIDQGYSKSNAGAREIRQSEREVAGSFRDIDQSSAEMSLGLGKRWDARRDFRDDRRDHKDELRDLEDDRNDLTVLEDRLIRQENIRERFAGWYVITETNDLSKIPEMNMLQSFLETMEEDLIWTEEELKEDKKELREDRRELREDRREARENRKERRIERQYKRYH